ncbi:hypothetical protein [Jannaschia sp. CCS1]|uniref:hypothetical protein n=1 Tax=Jannaschia sp. (strain CCS1) TaxID=290400 RepID=UPI000053C175|nr:hypothetical protein [Jannaschia sp. CCS1]ABD54545.1 hypothetical protein Jann_1628 [Jannaschia sp. CCS1]
MLRCVFTSVFASLVAGLALATPAHAQCEDLSSLQNVVELVSATRAARDTAQLTRLGHDLDAALDRLDTAQLTPILQAEYQFTVTGWIERTLHTLDQVAQAAQAGDIETAQTLAQGTRVSVGVSRFQLTSAPSRCVSLDPQQTSDGRTSTVSEFETASFTSPIDAIINNAVSPDLAAARMMADARRSSAPARGLLLIPPLLLCVGLLIWALRSKMSKALWLANQRKMPRHACAYVTSVRKMPGTGINRVLDQADGTAQGALASRILDINRFGVAIAQPESPITDGSVEFQIEDTWVLGQIRWSNQSCFGVQTMTPIDEDLVATVVASRAPQPSSATGKGGLALS